MLRLEAIGRRPTCILHSIEANIAGQSLSSVLHSCSYTEGKVLLHDRAYLLYFYICKYT